MMKFREITASIIQILGDAADGRYRVIGYQGQSQGFVGNSKEVQVFYNAGDFSGNRHGPTQHAMTFSVGLTVSAAASVNLAVINREGVLPAQVAGALAALKDAAQIADAAWDELAEWVYQVLMDGRNYDLGLAVGDTADRWVGQIRKDNPLPHGDLVVITGVLQLECSAAETVLGDVGVPCEAVDVSYEMPGDTVQITASLIS
jgi:hypothetical protein